MNVSTSIGPMWRVVHAVNINEWAQKIQPFGAPHGSLFVPLLFILYTAGLSDRPHRIIWSSPVHRWHTDTGLLSSWVCWAAPVHPVFLPGRSVGLDAVKSSPVEHCEDGGPLMLDHTSTEPTVICCCSRRRGPRVAFDHCRRPVNSHWQQCHYAVSRVTYGVELFAVLRQLRSIRRSVSDSVLHSLVVSLVKTPIQHSQGFLRPSFVDFSRCSMPPSDWYIDLLGLSTSHRCCRTCTAVWFSLTKTKIENGEKRKNNEFVTEN